MMHALFAGIDTSGCTPMEKFWVGLACLVAFYAALALKNKKWI